ncbi:MAG: sensor histidine kinase, partial [Halohasta sp.]
DLLRILATSLSAAMVRVEREAELQRQNDRLSEFTGYVSHDLRNPLSVAQGYVDQIKATGDTDTLAAVERAHDRMQTLIDDMLLLARKGEVIDMVGPTRVETIAEWAWEAVESRDADLEIEGRLTVEADAPRLQQVFENLFRNSVEHGGPELTVTVECHDNWFAVADDGHGFDGDPPTLDAETHESESGLGLSIVAKIIEAHGWEITAEHGSDGGSRFEITGVEPVEPDADGEGDPGGDSESAQAETEPSVDQ